MIHTLGEDIDARWRFFVHYDGTTGTATEYNTFASSIASAWNSNLSAFAFSDCTLTEVIVTDLSDPSAAVGSWSGSHVGTNTGEPLPANAAFIVRFHQDRRYRGGHPKVFLPYLVAESLDSVQEWIPATVAGLVAAFEAFLTDMLTDGWSGSGTLTHVLVSFFQGFTNVLYPSGRYHAKPTPRSSPLVTPVTGYSGNPKVGSQRRRNQQSS
jgi:hypothetical protein